MDVELFPELSVDGFRPHALHASERCWVETNCSIDLWIELLHALGLPPEAALGFTARQDFEGDQFSFGKFPHAELQALFGLNVRELSIFRPLETQVLTQMRRGRLCLVEVDPFHLPDTGIAAYRRVHGKTTIAPNRIDADKRVLEYFHNGGYYRLEGEDYDGVLRPPGVAEGLFRPYTEFTNLDAQPLAPDALRALSAELYAWHLAHRPAENPIRAFQAVAGEQAEALAGAGEQAFHDYAFHNLRMLGSNFELLGAGLAWLQGPQDPRIACCQAIAETAKGAQFQLARAVARRRFEGFAQTLDPAVEAWERLFDQASARHAA
jgi:hypothetical protein